MSQSRGYIDFAALKAAFTLEQILDHYGLLEKLEPNSGDTRRGCCPIHKGNKPSQFSVSLSKNMWNCFSECKHGGNHLDFVVAMENCSPNEAGWKVNEWLSLGLEAKVKERPQWKRKEEPSNKPSTRPPQVEQKEEPKANPIAPPATKEKKLEETGDNDVLKFTLDNLDATHPYLAERGLSAETIAHFGIGYCPKGIMAGRIAIPIHNADGHIVANAGRWPGDSPEGKDKYRLPSKFKKSLEVFNYHRAAIESDASPLVIVEGFFGVMHLWQLGIRRVVALMGWHMSARQEEMIAKLTTSESRIILMLDNDDAGNAARGSIVSRLAAYCFVRAFFWPDEIIQPTELSEVHLEGLIS